MQINNWLVPVEHNESYSDYMDRVSSLDWKFSEDQRSLSVPFIGCVSITADCPEGLEFEAFEFPVTEIQEPEVNWKITKAAFYCRFNEQEQFIIKSIELGAPISVPDGDGGFIETKMPTYLTIMINVLMEVIRNAEFIDLKDPRIISSIESLGYGGLIDVGRAEEILTTVPNPKEYKEYKE